MAALHTMWLAVFSTYVEVILRSMKMIDKELCFLHVCGGDPVRRLIKMLALGFSPRMWR